MTTGGSKEAQLAKHSFANEDISESGALFARISKKRTDLYHMLEKLNINHQAVI